VKDTRNSPLHDMSRPAGFSRAASRRLFPPLPRLFRTLRCRSLHSLLPRFVQIAVLIFRTRPALAFGRTNACTPRHPTPAGLLWGSPPRRFFKRGLGLSPQNRCAHSSRSLPATHQATPRVAPPRVPLPRAVPLYAAWPIFRVPLPGPIFSPTGEYRRYPRATAPRDAGVLPFPPTRRPPAEPVPPQNPQPL